MKFRATIQLYSKTGTGIVVPEEMVEGLGTGKRLPVRVTINNYTYRSTVALMRGEFKIPVSAGVAAGDEVDVDIELDTEPREVEVPPISRSR